MFNSELIVLSDGQSYRDVNVLEVQNGDFEKWNVKKPFAELTMAFFSDTQLIIAHAGCAGLIWLDRNKRTGTKDINFDRIVLSGDVVYGEGIIIASEDFVGLGIPSIFEDEEIDQMVFSCKEGTIITHAANIASIVVNYPRGERGVTKGIVQSKPEELSQITRQGRIPRK